MWCGVCVCFLCFFFFNDRETTEIYTSLFVGSVSVYKRQHLAIGPGSFSTPRPHGGTWQKKALAFPLNRMKSLGKKPLKLLVLCSMSKYSWLKNKVKRYRSE